MVLTFKLSANSNVKLVPLLTQFAVIACNCVTGFDGAHIQIVCQFKRQAGAAVDPIRCNCL